MYIWHFYTYLYKLYFWIFIQVKLIHLIPLLAIQKVIPRVYILVFPINNYLKNVPCNLSINNTSFFLCLTYRVSTWRNKIFYIGESLVLTKIMSRCVSPFLLNSIIYLHVEVNTNREKRYGTCLNVGQYRHLKIRTLNAITLTLYKTYRFICYYIAILAVSSIFFMDNNELQQFEYTNGFVLIKNQTFFCFTIETKGTRFT